MKQLLIMLALCFPTCLARKNTARILSNENSPSWRNPLKSAFSFFQSANEVSTENRNIETSTKRASRNRRNSMGKTYSVLPDSELESQPVQSTSLMNFINSVGSMVQDSMNFLLGRKNNKEELIARQQQRMKTYKHVYIIPTTPPQLQNDKFFHQGNTKAYLLRRTLRQTSKLLDPADSNSGVNNVLKNLYAVVKYGKELLSDKHKSKIVEMFRNFFNRKASAYRRRTSYKTSSYASSKLAKKPTSRRIPT